MPCGQYEAMAKELGFSCGDYTDEQKAEFTKKMETMLSEGKSPEEAIKAILGSVSAQRVNNPSMVDGFDAEWTPEGHLVMKDVPVFLPTEKKGRKFTRKWMKGALKDAKQGEADGYLPPMHVKHHGQGGVIPAGMFRMNDIDLRQFKGKAQPMLLVDKIFTNPDVIEDVLAGRLPYRSVEIFDATKEKIDGLALLDDEAPFLELPITKVRSVAEGGEEVPESVSPDTFSRDWAMVGCEADSPFVACFSRGNTYAFLMEKPMGPEYKPVEFQKDPEEEAAEAVGVEEETATAVAEEEAPEGVEEEVTEEVAEEPTDAEPFGGEEEAAAPEAAPEQQTSVSVDAIIGAIVSGSISVADLHAIQKAIADIEGGAHGEEPPMAGEEEQDKEALKEAVKKDVEAAPPPPLASPGEAMQREEEEKPEVTLDAEPETDEEKARLMGRVDSLEAWKSERERDDAIREAVDEALDSLQGRALGHEPRERFTAFAREHGVPAFKAYAEELAKELPPVSASRFAEDPDSFDFGKSLPDEVLVFQKDGPDAVERAAGHARMYEELQSKGMANVSLERYLDINMNGLSGAK